MANETTITITGNLTRDPELRFTPNGHAVATLTIATTPRTYNRTTNQWQDGETLFLRATAWRQLAENLTQSITKGTRVIATGNLTARTYTTRDGHQKTETELQLTDIGPSLTRATTQTTPNPTPHTPQPQHDPWTTTPDTPPF